MGTYVNPGNAAFRRLLGPYYIDKTELIQLMNSRVGGNESLVCVSRPRRFGKSYVAKMLAAYYDLSCDSHPLFDDKKIAGSADYAEHLNKYNVISLDISGFVSEVKKLNGSLRTIPARIERAVWKDLVGCGFTPDAGDTLNDFLIRIVEQPDGKPFIFVIDEWDAMIREAKDDEDAQVAYLNLLRGWFKNTNFTPKVVAAAYITGILPIKKDGSQSAISDFREFSMLEPDDFAEYYGFTEDEVEDICEKRDLSFQDIKRWYDGYTIGNIRSMYNPYSVMEAASRGKYRSYWKKTSAAETLKTYIDMDLDGLQNCMIALIAGQKIEVDTESFQNDFESFSCKDDVLTLLIHLGYLSYEEESNSGLAWVPNEEVRIEFDKILRRAKHTRLIELVRQSDQLLSDTLQMKEEKVAKAIQKVHDTSYAPTFYNNEQSLRYTVKMAYISCVDQYATVEELSSGHGVSDTVFLPKRGSALPALVVELKWNLSAEGAIAQIKNLDYANIPVELAGDVLLVGINYDQTTKTHTCKIERVNLRTVRN